MQLLRQSARRVLNFRSSNVVTFPSQQIFSSKVKGLSHDDHPAYQVACLSSGGSHSDFEPKRAHVEDDEAIAIIKEHVESNPIMLYMKGNPSQPQCGFSARVVQVLQSEGVDFSSVNVLDYPSIREGVKKFSEWPTIPQLYVNGEFLGGCDIVIGMHETGELKDVLKDAKFEKNIN